VAGLLQRLVRPALSQLRRPRLPGTEGRPPLSYPRRPVSMPVVPLVLGAYALRPLVRLGRGAIFGPRCW